MQDDEGLWPPGPRHPHLRSGEVHLWYGRLDDQGAVQEDPEASLSADEIERAAAFGDRELRRRFRTGRQRLRALLGGYLDRPAGELRFEYGEAGKPSLRDPASDLRFNLSHSGEHLLIGVSTGLELGVDVEELRPVRRREAIARRVLSADERAVISRFVGADRDVAFLLFWTGKEAVVKASGGGVATLLSGVEGGVSTGPLDLSPALGAVDRGGAGIRCGALAPSPGCVGAVAVRSDEPLVTRCWRLDPHLPTP